MMISSFTRAAPALRRTTRSCLLIGVLALSSLLSACVSTGFNLNQIDTRVSAKAQESRVRFLILHYTALDHDKSLKVLSEQAVSAHYLVSNEDKPRVYQLVDENKMAYHAGLSSWKNYTALNASSIGIEIVNFGFEETPDGKRFFAFPSQQIDAVIMLAKDIAARHQIKPEFVLGHSDIAPQRKSDPGPYFPWKRFAEAGLILWPDEQLVAQQKALFEAQLPDVTWMQKKLAEFGYATPQTGKLDPETKNVITAFQMRYRPNLFDGNIDAETAAMLEVLTRKAPQPASTAGAKP
ncbi:N-acetylmuramoyl-L-alanine amidase [Undibacterium cyanobacteriorum]|uniref:N-acetylmuramoyl-L-alanine amidase n=2 Tax=Undibacterium cyanobacteriorum TaxID=3073561 RepID=A0ABY9RFS8_9BURK|nr:N-acetylmuramoyl-L-alanine amidase [Undibacterium sp. 20NA77.5]WMW80088.1 N-acetylmuramoyl-L-alanine amidase [Undibacterium sp. 20NA77.5]